MPTNPDLYDEHGRCIEVPPTKNYWFTGMALLILLAASIFVVDFFPQIKTFLADLVR